MLSMFFAQEEEKLSNFKFKKRQAIVKPKPQASNKIPQQICCLCCRSVNVFSSIYKCPFLKLGLVSPLATHTHSHKLLLFINFLSHSSLLLLRVRVNLSNKQSSDDPFSVLNKSRRFFQQQSDSRRSRRSSLGLFLSKRARRSSIHKDNDDPLQPIN